MTTPTITPLPLLSTPRLLLRPVSPTDAEALHAHLQDPEVTRHLDLGENEGVERLRERLACEAGAPERGTGARWVLLRREAGDTAQPVGNVALFGWDAQARRAEVGAVLAREAWGQGLVQEALGAVLRFGFEVMDLQRVEAETDLGNAAALRLLQRLGFCEVGGGRFALARPVR
jgi:RimJ/RimL family protein N-acetyltransferase